METGPSPPLAGTAALVALGLAGLCAFLNVYCTQPLLLLFGSSFAITKAQAALTVSAPTIAVALASPFIGAAADRLGRRRTIVGCLFLLVVPTLGAASARTLAGLVAWRFLQGLAVPGVYAVSIAYISEAWRGRGVGKAMSALITGNVLGGFLGRFLGGVVAELAGWRASFVVLAALTLGGAVATARWLPAEPPRTSPAASPLAALRALWRKLDARLVATLVVGFNVLFTLVATFTYVTFHLAAPPFNLGTAAVSSLFVVYLIGAVVTPFAGRWIDRVGSRLAIGTALLGASGGALLTLVPSLPTVVAGLALVCTGTFVCQSAATSFLQVAAPPEVRSAASGVYVSFYYIGGSAGGLLPSAAWRLGGWPACVALVVLVQLATVGLALRFWRGDAPHPAAPPLAI